MKNLKNLILGLLVTIFISGNTFGQFCEDLSSLFENTTITSIHESSLKYQNGTLVSNDEINPIYVKDLDKDYYDKLEDSIFMNTFGLVNGFCNEFVIIVPQNDGDFSFPDSENEFFMIGVGDMEKILIYKTSEGVNVIKFTCITLSIYEFENIDFSIFPNPTSDFINIKTDEWNVETTIMDINGNISIKSDSKQIDIRDLPQGTYLVSVNNSKPKRIVKN